MIVDLTKIYANRSFVFSNLKTWSFEEYYFLQQDDFIFVQLDFYNDITQSQIEEVQTKNPNLDKLQVQFEKQDRNYFPQYFQSVNHNLFRYEVKFNALYKYLMQSSLPPINFYIYCQLQKSFRIQSAQIYGSDYMLYDKGNDEQHIHSQTLVKIQNNNLTWTDLYRQIRLANAVNKSLIVVFVKQEKNLQNLDIQSLNQLILSKNMDLFKEQLNISIQKEIRISCLQAKDITNKDQQTSQYFKKQQDIN